MKDLEIKAIHLPQNPMADLLKRLDAQDALNQEQAKLLSETTELLREVVNEQRQQSELIAKIVQWIESNRK